VFLTFYYQCLHLYHVKCFHASFSTFGARCINAFLLDPFGL
jgi:hypothetical protein